jgi:hypothetical protein
VSFEQIEAVITDEEKSWAESKSRRQEIGIHPEVENQQRKRKTNLDFCREKQKTGPKLRELDLGKQTGLNIALQICRVPKTTRAADKETNNRGTDLELKWKTGFLQPRKSGLARTACEQEKTASSAGGNQKKEPNQEMPDHGQNEDRRKRPSPNRLSGGSSLNRREEKSQQTENELINQTKSWDLQARPQRHIFRSAGQIT